MSRGLDVIYVFASDQNVKMLYNIPVNIIICFHIFRLYVHVCGLMRANA